MPRGFPCPAETQPGKVRDTSGEGTWKPSDPSAAGFLWCVTSNRDKVMSETERHLRHSRSFAVRLQAQLFTLGSICESVLIEAALRVASTPQAVILKQREGRERDLELHKRERARESHSNTADDVVSSERQCSSQVRTWSWKIKASANAPVLDEQYRRGFTFILKK